MRKLKFVLAAIFLFNLAACNLTKNKQQSFELYYWGNYLNSVHAYAEQKFELAKEINLLEQNIIKAKEASKNVPPGLKAHLAVLYLHAGNNAQAFNLLEEEKAAFPAGRDFIAFQQRYIKVDNAQLDKIKVQPNIAPIKTLNSILVLPPRNNSVEISAPATVLTHSVKELSERGYYVIPIANMQEVLVNNGIYSAEEAHEIPLPKLYEVFGADNVLYLEIDNFGANYKVVKSEVAVEVKAQMINVKNGNVLWQSEVRKKQHSTNYDNDVLDIFVGAVVDQIDNNVADSAYKLSAYVMHELFEKQMAKSKYKYQFEEQNQMKSAIKKETKKQVIKGLVRQLTK